MARRSAERRPPVRPRTFRRNDPRPSGAAPARRASSRAGGLNETIDLSAYEYLDALPPQYRLHWYVLERVLGQGGFGITYLARDTHLDRPVAIKEYLPVEVATRSAGAMVRARTVAQCDRYRRGLDGFVREARTLARFDHPNIARVHTIFECNNTAYMVMRFEAGENLAARLEQRGTLSECELLHAIAPVLDGLELVHGAGFTHRDVKPDNIYIRTDGAPVLLDFGSARHAVGRAHTLTVLVAPGYAPLEQYYSGAERQGPWTDIYGLGATCYRAIAGQAPLDAIARSKGILGSARDMLVPATRVGAGRYSGRLLAAIDHALALAEQDRPQTIAAWRRELIGDQRWAAVTPRIGAPYPTPARSAARGRTTPITWGIAGAALAAAAIGVVLHVRGVVSEPATRPPTEFPADAADRIIELERELEQAKEQAARAEAERRLLEEAQQREEERRRRDLERRGLDLADGSRGPGGPALYGRVAARVRRRYCDAANRRGMRSSQREENLTSTLALRGRRRCRTAASHGCCSR